MHKKILNFINTISIRSNTIEIERIEDKDRVLSNTGKVKISVPSSEVVFVFDNDNGEMEYIVNFKD
jgi:hypothetical protein|tara:strand:- start:40 stop:237 length:198 start_codon:yes stop_codon:yes gene_type:complete